MGMEARVLIKNLLSAVAFVHSKGIMHRDLKPENILLASKVSNTDIKISDFGLAKISKDYPRRLPRSHSICGSDFYLAPEVIKQEEYGREIDVWSVGVVCYVILSGSLPFFHNVLHKLYRQIVERDLSFPEQAWTSVSEGAQDFILRLLQVRPGDRLTAEQSLSHPWHRRSNAQAIIRMDTAGPLAVRRTSRTPWSTRTRLRSETCALVSACVRKVLLSALRLLCRSAGKWPTPISPIGASNSCHML